jgi:hypothetical protein
MDSARIAQSNVREQWVSSKENAFNAVHSSVSASFGSCSIRWASFLWTPCKIVPGGLGMPGTCLFCRSIGVAGVHFSGRPSDKEGHTFEVRFPVQGISAQTLRLIQIQSPDSHTNILCQAQSKSTDYDCIRHYHSR